MELSIVRNDGRGFRKFERSCGFMKKMKHDGIDLVSRVKLIGCCCIFNGV